MLSFECPESQATRGVRHITTGVGGEVIASIPTCYHQPPPLSLHGQQEMDSVHVPMVERNRARWVWQWVWLQRWLYEWQGHCQDNSCTRPHYEGGGGGVEGGDVQATTLVVSDDGVTSCVKTSAPSRKHILTCVYTHREPGISTHKDWYDNSKAL